MRQRSRTLRLSLLGSRGGAVALIAIGMLLLGMLAGCGGGASQTPRSSTGVAPSPAGSASPAVSSRKTTPNVPEIVKPAAVAPFQGGPRIAVQEESYDFGKVKLDDWVQATFHVQNVGDAALILNGQPGVRTIQGC